jgi:hypothetical protein
MNNDNDIITVTEDQQIGYRPWKYADTARVMATIVPGFDWDSWKDEMKERDL